MATFSSRRVGISLAALAAAVALVATGCADVDDADVDGAATTAPPSAGPSDDNILTEPLTATVGTPAGVAEQGDIGSPYAAWLDEGKKIAVVTYGSSICLPVANEIEGDDDENAVDISVAAAENVACTADLVPRYWEFETPSTVTPDELVRITIEYEDDGFPDQVIKLEAF
ncbi:hypothetical protein [Lysinibacter cavernae]|uniref:Lipoprotein n=1 Tax=Lysinibacter cavernae TaxID=1640652 RepID=A0A7X5R243_9MICO|nr:hypothetical protein [Lysinibacter cavernae]NIH54270.1 hypothetical protein [Lysinibacter cavernae]